MNKEEEGKMLELKDYNESTSNTELDMNKVKRLINSKQPIQCKNGHMQIDHSHPDYDFWIED